MLFQSGVDKVILGMVLQILVNFVSDILDILPPNIDPLLIEPVLDRVHHL